MVRDEYTDASVWNAVHDAAMLQVGDPDQARRVADRVISDVKDGRSYHRQNDKERRGRTRKRVLKISAGWGAALSVLGGAAVGITALVHAQDDNYAGYGPNNVLKHGQIAVSSWYGLDNAPDNLRVVKKSHSRVYGQDAWKVDYRTRSGERVCAWVWLAGQSVPGSHTTSGESDDLWKVEEDKSCA